MRVCLCVSKGRWVQSREAAFWPKAKISEGESRWWWWWWRGGHNGLSQAISERSGAVFSGAVRSAKLALISPVVGDV